MFPVIEKNMIVPDATEQLRNKASEIKTILNPL